MTHARPALRSLAPLRASATAIVIALLPGFVSAAPPQPSAEQAARFAPVGELAGSCWESPMPGEARDVHCYEWILDGAFLRDTHEVTGPRGTYAGEAIYGWDAERGALHYWCFNTLGGVSQGEARREGETWTFSETYRGGGKVLEFRTTQTRPGPDSYERVTEELRDGAWKAAPPLRFTRVGSKP